ncbi:hypothetical protein J6590_023349, partial [Homalodisca vitripennis]
APIPWKAVVHVLIARGFQIQFLIKDFLTYSGRRFEVKQSMLEVTGCWGLGTIRK